MADLVSVDHDPFGDQSVVVAQPGYGPQHAVADINAQLARGGRVGHKKLPHSAVGYIPQSRLKGKHCSVCTMFREGPHCTLVRDPIEAGGWCRRFAAKGSG